MNRTATIIRRTAGGLRGSANNSIEQGHIMSRRLRSLPIMMAVVGIGMTGCDFLDPTAVTNPTVTDEGFLETSSAASVWTSGVERQLAATMNQVVMGAEVVSDNVFNNRTLFSKVFDIPEIEPHDFDVTNIHAGIGRLRIMADYGLNTVVPADATTTDETRARLHFHRAFAALLAGELFVGMPAEVDGPIVGPEAHLASAVADFQSARTLSSDASMQVAALLGIARAEYRAGNRTAAVAAATAARAMNPMALRTVGYDITDGPTNQMQFAIYDSGQGEFQPLPRLDFLFPKYFSTFAGEQKPIPVLKGEEAVLILAEAALAGGDLDGGRALLVDVLEITEQRPIATVNDAGQLRGRVGGTWIFPNSEDVQVAASPQDQPRSGLVLTRSNGPVQVPTVSGTSATREMIADATDEAELLELLYLMRQEIFVLEGRRMADLGIRFPVSRTEAQVNPNVALDSPALVARIPSFIPRDLGLDRFAYTDGDTLATIAFNMNRLLVENRSSDAVLPFH